ncbi:MAG: Ig-like domain-containing protein [Saprospiraceae bacterium]
MRTAIDLRNSDQATLRFDVAYAIRHEGHFDELRVNLRDSNGNLHNIYNKGGAVLATWHTPQPDFEPTECSHWRTESVPLNDWQGQQIVLEIESIGDRGNSIFLDNVAVWSNAIPTAYLAWPADQAYFMGDDTPYTLSMRAEAFDADGEINRVDFFVENTWVGTDTSPPYEAAFTLPGWGAYRLQARAKDDAGSEVWTPVHTIYYDFENGTSQPANRLAGRIVPNPASDNAFLHCTLFEAEDQVILTLHDVHGRKLREEKWRLAAGENRIPLPVAGLPAGTYLLQWHTRTGVYPLFFVKQ